MSRARCLSAAVIALATALLAAAPAYAGPGGVVTFSNTTSRTVTLSSASISCMFTNDEQGSQLDRIDGASLAPGEQRGFYVEGRGSGDPTKLRDQRALVQGWLIGPKRTVSRTTMRAAARKLTDGDALDSGFSCRHSASLFGVMALAGDDYAAQIVRVSCPGIFCEVTWTTQSSASDGLRMTFDDREYPIVAIADGRR